MRDQKFQGFPRIALSSEDHHCVCRALLGVVLAVFDAQELFDMGGDYCNVARSCLRHAPQSKSDKSADTVAKVSLARKSHAATEFRVHLNYGGWQDSTGREKGLLQLLRLFRMYSFRL